MSSGVFNLVVDVLATKRMTRLIVDDAITEDIRELVWKRFPPEENKFGYLFTCHACTSIWTGGVIASGLVPSFLRTTLALSELVLQLQAVEDRITES